MATYNLRNNKKDYKQLANPRLPRAERVRHRADPDKLYEVEVVERDGERLKVHYVGYSTDYDEWKEAADIVHNADLTATDGSGGHQMETYHPFDLHRELVYHIKLALNSGTRRDVEVRIELHFDELIFAGGLQRLGTFIRNCRGHKVYGINHYRDLEPLLGDKWHMRGLNKYLDFCYVNLETVQFYLYHKADIADFRPSGETVAVHGGCMLVFKFVRMDGTRAQWDNVSKIL